MEQIKLLLALCAFFAVLPLHTEITSSDTTICVPLFLLNNDNHYQVKEEIFEIDRKSNKQLDNYNLSIFTEKLNLFNQNEFFFSSCTDFQENESDYSLNSINKIELENKELEEKRTINLSRLDDSLYQFNGYKRYTLTGENPYIENNVETKDIAIYGGGLTAVFLLQHYVQLNANWKDKREFKFIEDSKWSLYSDKFTHFWTTYFPSYMFSEGLIAMGFNKKNSVLWGSVLGLGYQTYIEIMDGFGQNYGFSPSDYYADIAGAAFYYLQNEYGIAEWVTPKFAYIPSDMHGELKRIPHTNFIDDYSSQTVYFSFNIHPILPSSIQNYWPEWLELTVGYAARNLVNAGPNVYPEYDFSRTTYQGIAYNQSPVYGKPSLIIGLDYNLVKLLPDGSTGWNWFKQTLNFIKLPSPAIEISDKVRFFLIYPFPINF